MENSGFCPLGTRIKTNFCTGALPVQHSLSLCNISKLVEIILSFSEISYGICTLTFLPYALLESHSSNSTNPGNACPTWHYNKTKDTANRLIQMWEAANFWKKHEMRATIQEIIWVVPEVQRRRWEEQRIKTWSYCREAHQVQGHILLTLQSIYKSSHLPEKSLLWMVIQWQILFCFHSVLCIFNESATQIKPCK